MRPNDSETEDIIVDHNRVARDYALMRLEYIKFSTGNHLESCLTQIIKDFNNAQERLLSSLDAKSRKTENKVSQLFDKVLKEVKLVIAGKSKKHVTAILSEKSSPVTRLRRRASIEASENVSSPATPTKKKVGRLAAKPLLDNIDENAPISSPKPKRRTSVARDNPVEEKPLTPARRSTRIRSNTSLTAETPQGFESPRAKRISRRNSLAGSDNEAAVTTPVKPTRRTRKASTSSVENGGEPTYVIVVEPDGKKPSEEALSNDENLSPNNVRKSARLQSKPRKSLAESPAVLKPKKINRKSTSPKQISNGSESLQNGEISLSSEKPDLLNEINIISKDNTEKLNSAEHEKSAEVKLLTSVETELQNSNIKSSANISNSDITSKIDAVDSVHAKATNDASTKAPLQNISVNEPKDTTDSANSAKPDALDELLVEVNPGTVMCTVLFEDSNYGNIDKEIDDGQWVPVRQLETLSQMPLTTMASVNISQEKPRSTSTSTVIACEPMDIDETMPDNVSLTDHLNEFETSSLENNNSIKNKRKLSFTQSKVTSQLNETPNCLESAISEENKKKYDTSGLSTSTEKKNNRSKTKLSLSQSVTSTNVEKEIQTSQSNTPTIDKSKRKLSVSQSTSLIVASAKEDANKSATNTEESDNISKHESPVIEEEKNKKAPENKSLTLNTQDLEKSSNENKSTLILSQIKDDETGVAKSPKVTNISQQNEMETSLKGNESCKLNNISNIKSSEDTPLKAKAAKALGMQTSTPVISNNIEKKGKQKKSVVENPKKAITNKKQNTSDKSSHDSKSSESDFIDDEAEDAGDDYESGDSRDDEQIRYEEENEIVERGETLDSDDEASNDTDYEKDSFVVSSDPEDQELLDGSGEDLNSSDNELTMSAKSKKKFNERKSKEQKKASKEMFESRHKNKSLYESSSSSEDEDSKPKTKNNRLRLDSSDLVSQDDPVKSVKGKRMRIDSTFDDSSINGNANVSINKKKVLPNSSTDVINENEITAICDESMLKKKDPLKVDVKLEPKTPQKDLDISTVNFSTHLPISEVQVNENVSMVGPNEASDPLHDDDDDDSQDSDNQNKNDYSFSSVLKILNKSKQNKSLDSTKKLKKPGKTIVDELNLTGSKAKPKATTKKAKKPKTPDDFNDDEFSSYSIDLKQLLDPDSDSEDGGPADFIPLRKSEAKTNIRTDTNIGENVQKISLDMDEIDGQQNLEEPLNNNLNSKVSDKNEIMQCQTDSGKKKKNKKSISSADDSAQSKSIHEIPTEISELQENNSSLSKRKKNKSLSYSEEIDEEAQNISEKKHKKKHITSFSNNSEQADSEITEYKDVSEQNIVESTESKDRSVSKKNKKTKKNKVAGTNTNNVGLENEHEDKLELSTGITEMQNTSLSKEKKKMKKVDLENEHENVLQRNTEITDVQNTSLSKKKKKKHSTSLNDTKDTSFTKTKNMANSVTGTDVLETELEALLTTLPTDAQEGSHKKKKKKSDAHVTDTNIVPETESIDFCAETHVPEIFNSIGKKRKRKSSGAIAEELEDAPTKCSAAGGESKRMKLSNSDSAPQTDAISSENQQDISDSSMQKKKKKKKKNKIIPESEDVSVADELKQNTETTEVQNTSLSKKKKKKHATLSNETKDKSLTKMQNATDLVTETDVLETELEMLLTTLPTDSVNKSVQYEKELDELLTILPTDDGSSDAQSAPHTDVSSTAGGETKSIKLANSDNAPQTDDISPEHQQDKSDSSTQKRKKKKKKNDKKSPESEDADVADDISPEEQQDISDSSTHKKKKKKDKKTLESENFIEADNAKQSKKNKKRKERDDDEEQNQAKLFKESHHNKIHVPRLPSSLLQELDVNSKPKRAQKVVSITNFEVEESHTRRKNKPSNYLEESVYLDSETPDKKKKVAKINKPKVLPFMPTASTSSYGFTSNCKVNVIPTETKFLAQSSNISNFKNDYLYGNSIKRLGTYEFYKKQRTLKLSKF